MASSNIIILFYFKIALPKQISYFYPTENTEDEKLISVNIPLSNFST